MEITSTLIWAVLGLCLIVAEVLTNSFFLLFFGAAALVVAVLRFFWLNHLPTEMAIFAVIGLASTLLFRKKLRTSLKGNGGITLDVGEKVQLTEDILAKASSTITYRGTRWTAINDSNTNFKIGDFALIARIDGVKVILKEVP